MKIFGFILLLFMLWGGFTRAQNMIPLYEGHIPGSKDCLDKEYSKNGDYYNVSKPNLSIYLPKDQNKEKTSVIICPGGGYEAVCATREGHKIALEMNKKGVAAFVLKYRLPNDSTCANKAIAPLQDAQRAIQIVRDSAIAWGIDPDRIGIMGFSAGGHLAATAGTHFAKSYIENKEGTSLRPDFMILVYPVISMQSGLTHQGSRVSLLGENPKAELVDLFSNEKQVTLETPPTFLTHAEDDDLVSVENSICFYKALLKKGVSADMHLFSKGNHGYFQEPAASSWMEYVFKWMSEKQLIDKTYKN